MEAGKTLIRLYTAEILVPGKGIDKFVRNKFGPRFSVARKAQNREVLCQPPHDHVNQN